MISSDPPNIISRVSLKQMLLSFWEATRSHFLKLLHSFLLAHSGKRLVLIIDQLEGLLAQPHIKDEKDWRSVLDNLSEAQLENLISLCAKGPVQLHVVVHYVHLGRVKTLLHLHFPGVLDHIQQISQVFLHAPAHLLAFALVFLLRSSFFMTRFFQLFNSLVFLDDQGF